MVGDIIGQLQRLGAALTACECGSFSWAPPEHMFVLVPAYPTLTNGPGKRVVAISCAQCGLTKFYDAAIARVLQEPDDSI